MGSARRGVLHGDTGVDGREVSIVMVDGHAMVRAGLQRLVEAEPGYRVTGVAGDGAAALQILRNVPCDAVLVETAVPPPSGTELVSLIRAQCPTLPILVVSVNTCPRVVRAALNAGAAGYVGKDSEPEQLLDALSALVAGERYVEPRLANALLFPEEESLPHDRLSPRKMQVLRKLSQGFTNSEIAREFGLSEKTIGTHKGNLMRKLGVNNMAELIRYADDNLTPERSFASAWYPAPR